MNYESIIRAWVKTLSDEDFLRYKNTLIKEIEEEETKRGIK